VPCGRIAGVNPTAEPVTGPDRARRPRAGALAGALADALADALAGPAGGIITWLVICVSAAAWGWNRRSPGAFSWHYFADGTRALFGGSGLHLYADHPDLQIGPLAFAVVEALHSLPPTARQVAAQVLLTAVVPLLLLTLAPLVGASLPRRRLRLLLAALVLAPTWTVLAVRWIHVDDALAMIFATLAVRWVGLAIRQAAPRWTGPAAGLALGAAMAAKPWAAGFVPILLVLPVVPMLTAVAAAVVVAVAAWGPFLLADRGTLTAFHPPVEVTESSGLWTLGYRPVQLPSWGRTAQLLLAPAVALLGVLRRRWAGALLVAIAVRLALDPKDLGYYLGSAVLAALVFDLVGTGWTVPWTGLVTALALWQPTAHNYETRFTTEHGLSLWWFTHPLAVGVVHLVWSAAAVLLVIAAPAAWLGRRPDPSTSDPSTSDPSTPVSGPGTPA
jgi:hypothetical protein